LITVENLTKRYPAKTAIEGMSFKVEKGEILGFLGPNGAGKTTTMRIVTGFIPASEGTVRVDGFDVFENPSMSGAGLVICRRIRLSTWK
jgi:ABC-2 type transport system ATP-binding protein